jgi:hypothetical protein
MFKLGCLVMLFVLIGLPVLAGRFLPWWGTCLVILGEGLLLVFVAPRLIAIAIERVAVGLFRTKSAVLKAARVRVHCVEPTSEPTDGESDEIQTDGSAEQGPLDDQPTLPMRYVLIDFTLTPAPGASRMTHWEPRELMLVPFDLGNDIKEDDNRSASVARMTIVDEAGDSTEEFDKISGAARFKAVFACPPALTGRVKFRYYFEGLGDVQLP